MDRAVVEYLANAFWQVPLLVAGVAALLWALGADVRTRHRAWLAVLAVAVLMPLRGMDHSPSAAPGPVFVPSVQAAPVEIPVAEAPPPVHRSKPMLVFGEVSGRWLVRFYLAVSVFFAWRIARSWFAAQRLLRLARSIDLAPRALAIFAQVADGQGVPLPRLRQSDETISPVVIGAVRPVLLLPAGFDRLKDDEVRAALSHEFAHLARRDYLVNLICQLFTLPLAWHPAIHYVHKRIRDTREMLCDAVAAEEMASPVRYATCLVAFALRALDGHDAALSTQGVSMFDNRILEERILQLTQAPEQPDRSTRLARLAGASAGLVLAVAMALLFHITPIWAETPVAAAAQPPVELTPPAVELPAIPVPPASPATPAQAAAPAVQQRHAHKQLDDDTRRAMAEEDRQRAERQRDVAQQQREEGMRQREEAQRQREEGQRQREEAQRQREREREVAEQQREAAQEQREAAHEAMEEARREAIEASRNYAAEIRRQVSEAVKAGQSVHDVDMEKIKQEIAQASAAVHTPEFKAQMAELQAHMQELHDNMAQLREHMKALNHEVEKSYNSPM